MNTSSLPVARLIAMGARLGLDRLYRSGSLAPGRPSARTPAMALQPARASARAARQQRRARGQRIHDLAPLLRTHPRPARDLLGRAMAANADPRLRVDDADIDTRAL